MFIPFELLFFILFFFVFYTYLIYPLIIKLISLFVPFRKIHINNQSVSVLLSAYNEEEVIEDRVRNWADQDIDFSLIEVLIGSDGSTDKTNDILLRLKDEFTWLRIFLYEKQRGKPIVLNELEKKAKNDILIFTDANTVFEPDFRREICQGSTICSNIKFRVRPDIQFPGTD